MVKSYLHVSGPDELNFLPEKAHYGSYQVRESLDESLVKFHKPKEPLHPAYVQRHLPLGDGCNLARICNHSKSNWGDITAQKLYNILVKYAKLEKCKNLI